MENQGMECATENSVCVGNGNVYVEKKCCLAFADEKLAMKMWMLTSMYRSCTGVTFLKPVEKQGTNIIKD